MWVPRGLIDHMNPAFTNVIEFRHIRWWHNQVYSKLAKHAIHFCSISYPGFPNDVISGNPANLLPSSWYPRLYKSCYKKRGDDYLADQVKKSKKSKQAFIYFNNTWGTGALRNARQLLGYCHQPENKNSFSFQKST